jgi:hypothetical protein
MRLEIMSPSEVTVAGPDDCTTLSVGLTSLSPIEAGTILIEQGMARSGDQAVWLDVGELRKAAAPVTGSDWDQRFEAMICAVRTRGWPDDAGRFVRAHFRNQ